MFYLPFRLKIPQLPVGAIVDIFNVIFLGMLISGRKHLRIRPKFELPLFFFLFIWTVSFFYAVFQTIQSVGTPVIVLATNFKRLITLPIGYFVFTYCVKTKKESRLLFNVFLISLAIIGFYTFRTGILEGPSFADHKRGFGPFGESWRASDIAGAFLAMFGPFLFSYFLFAKQKILKLISGIGFIAIFAGVLSTYSRGSLLAIILGSAITFFSSFKFLLKRSKILIVMLCIVGSLGIIKWRYWMPQSLINRIDDTVTVDEQQSEESLDISSLDVGSQGRIFKWQVALDLFYAHPIMGIGFNQLDYRISYERNFDPHNGFIQIMAEMGSLGLLAFLWLLWCIFFEAKTLIKSEFNYLGAGFIGCLTALMVVNIFYSNFFRDNVVGSFWIILGLLAASKGFVAQGKQVVSNRKNNKRHNVALLGVIAFIFFIVPSAYAQTDSRWWNSSGTKALSVYNDFSHTPIGRDYYVDGKNGNDGNIGNSLDHAFKTIERALKELKGGDIILIKSGRYKINRITIYQKGSPENRIMIGPFGDGEVVIDASMNIGKWLPYKRNIYKTECLDKPVAVVINETPLFPEFSLRDVKEETWYYSWKEKVLYVYAPNGTNPNDSEVGVIEDSKKQHAIFLSGAQYVTLYGLTIKYAGGKGIEILGDHNRIERCNILFNGNSGISMFNYGKKVSHGTEIIKNRIYYNFMRNWPRGRWKDSGWGKGIDGFYAKDVKIIGNIISQNGGEGIGAPGDGAIIKDNIVSDNWSVNIYINKRKDVLVEGNLIFCHEPNMRDLYNNGDKNSRDGKCFRRLRAEGIMTADEKSPAVTSNIRITNNIIVNCRRGITHYGAVRGSAMKNILIAHNTIVLPNAKGNGEDFIGIKIPYNGGNNENVSIFNNIVSAKHSSTYLLHIKTDPLGRREPFLGLSFDHNLWYHSSKKKPFHLGSKWFRANDIDFKTWLKKVDYPEQEKGSKFAEPGFANDDTFTDGGLKLTVNSKAIDAGVIINSITNDYDNNLRSDGFPDIGAFEFIKKDKVNQ